MLGSLGNRALGLAERRLGRFGRLREGAAERFDEEQVGRFAERERGRLVGAANPSSGRGGEAAQVLRAAARRARGQLWKHPRREQQLEAEGEAVRGARV